MFLFLSFVVALVSLYYLGVMVDSYNPDTTYLTPLVTLLVYSLVTLIREVTHERAYRNKALAQIYGKTKTV